MAYSDDYVSLYTAIMSASMDTDSPYDKTVAKIIDFYEQREMTEELKAQYFTQYMSNITTGITTQAMNIALQATDRASLLPHQTTKARAEAEIADDSQRKEAMKDKPLKENIILDKQALKLDEDTNYVDLQGQALMAQVDDNRKIKVLQSYADVFLGLAAGGLTINAAQWSMLYTLAEAAAKGIDISSSIGSTSLQVQHGTVWFCNGALFTQTNLDDGSVHNMYDRIASLVSPEGIHMSDDPQAYTGWWWDVQLIRYRTGAGTEADPYAYWTPDLNQTEWDSELNRNITNGVHLDVNGDPYVSGVVKTGGVWLFGKDVPAEEVDSTSVNGVSGWKNGDAIWWDGTRFSRLGRDWI